MNRDIDISPEEFDNIEGYLLNVLPANELEVFERRLSNDHKLRDQLNAVRLLLLGVQEAALEEKIHDFHRDLPATEVNIAGRKAPLIGKWFMAAAAIIIVAAGAWLFLKPFGKEERLFSEYYKPDPGLITAMSTSDNYSFDRAMIDYKTGNYDSAIKAWEHLLVAKPGNDTLHYFIGSSWLALGESEKAITHLRKVTTVSGSYFLNDAYWYLGLALLKDDKKKEAVAFIEKSEHEQKASLMKKLGR